MKKQLFVLFICTMAVSCSKFVETRTPDSLFDGSKVFENDNSAIAVVNSILADLGRTSSVVQGYTGVSVVSGLLSDELHTVSRFGDYQELYRNAVLSNNPFIDNIWIGFYANLYKANTVLEGAVKSTTLSEKIKKQIIGESKFLRAFMNFYLVNLYGPVPLILSTNYEQNRSATRASVAQVYNQIIQDLKDAEGLLTSEYVNHTGAIITERYRPNKHAVQTLLARAYLYRGDWANAEAAATSVISQTARYDLETNLDNIYRQAASKEVIWNFAPFVSSAGVTTVYSGEGKHYSPALLKLQAVPPQSFAYEISTYLNDGIVNAFESGDKRKTDWLESVTAEGKTYFFPFKYKTGLFVLSTVQEYTVILRLAEVYLIRAEARARQGNANGAIQDVDVIRTRASLAGTTAATDAHMMAAIEQERRVELFTEWGHRWFDLKRWPGRNTPGINRAEEVMSVVTPLKGGVWNKNWLLLPIPATDIVNNPNLEQNPGYD
jgi:hypothetical protein